MLQSLFFPDWRRNDLFNFAHQLISLSFLQAKGTLESSFDTQTIFQTNLY